MNNVVVTFEDGEVKSFPAGTTYYEMIKSRNLEDDVIAVVVNDKVTNLGDKPQGKITLKYVRILSINGYRMYVAGLKMLLEAATKRLFPNIEVNFCYDVPHGISISFESNKILTEADIEKIKHEMEVMSDNNMVIKKKYMRSFEGIKYYQDKKNVVKEKNISNLMDPIIILYQLDKVSDYYYYEMPYTTGILKGYEFRYLQDNKALLLYPTPFDDKHITSENNISKVVQYYEWGKKWLELVKIPYINDVNTLISRGKIKDFVNTCELKFNLEINDAAMHVFNHPEIKFILLAGPSSSGKTTVTNRLANYLKIYGKEPIVISVDDYYKERVDTPKDEYGNYDFECPEATDTEYLLSDVQKFLNGEEIQLPVFNFVTGCKELKGPKIKMAPNSIVLFEGVNCLHPSVLNIIDDSQKYYIYVSPYMPLCIDQQNFISSNDLRLLRRLIRDFRTRGYSVEDTLDMWLRVRLGEEKHILPYIHRADRILNTALPYEVGALKVLVAPLLLSVPASSKNYGEARRLLSFLKQFFTIDCEHVPNDSIVREFIGGKND